MSFCIGLVDVRLGNKGKYAIDHINILIIWSSPSPSFATKIDNEIYKNSNQCFINKDETEGLLIDNFMISYIKNQVSYIIDMITIMLWNFLHFILMLVLVKDINGLKTSLGNKISKRIIIIVIQIVTLLPGVNENSRV